MLCQYYYFIKLPETWIDLKVEKNETDISAENKIEIPETIETIYNHLQTKEVDTTNILLPITEQTAVTPTLNLLHQYFNFKDIPEFLLKLPSLLEPSWEIFNNSNDY